MFPHIAGKGGLFEPRTSWDSSPSASHVLRTGGAVEARLLQVRGTVTDGDAQRDYGNTWQAATQAAEGGFVLVDTALSMRRVKRGIAVPWRGLTQERGQVRAGVVHYSAEGELDGVTCPEPDVLQGRQLLGHRSRLFQRGNTDDVVKDTLVTASTLLFNL